jgi:hypothetical protein
MQQLETTFGMAGVFALESMCVTEADCAEGFDHVCELIAPALEEELIAQDRTSNGTD